MQSSVDVAGGRPANNAPAVVTDFPPSASSNVAAAAATSEGPVINEVLPDEHYESSSSFPPTVRLPLRWLL